MTEAKHQGKDVENIKNGVLVGTNNDQDLMDAGNAIERSHKNISEIAIFMLSESHFPYVLFLEGSNFLTETISITRPDGRVVNLEYNSGKLKILSPSPAFRWPRGVRASGDAQRDGLCPAAGPTDQR